MFRPLRLAAASLMLLVLAACGGGGGGSDESSAAAAPQVVIRATALAATSETGSNLTSGLGGTIALDGSGSRAGSGTLASFSWTVETRPTGSTAALVDATSARASFVPDAVGAYTLRLRITDSAGGSGSSTLNITVGPAPAAPNVITAVSFSGPSTELPTLGSAVGAPVTMDASGSTDPAGGPLTLSWTLLARPAGSTAAITVSGARGSFTPDLPGTYRVRVRATTSAGAIADALQTYTIADTTPRVLVSSVVTAMGGGGRTLDVAVGNLVELNAFDAVTGLSLSSPTWVLVSKPFFSSLTGLTGPTPSRVQFTPDTSGRYVIQVSALDANGVRNAYTLNVDAAAGPRVAVSASVTPVAAATGPSFVAAPGRTLTLRGSGSADPAGGALTYAWRVSSQPDLSSATLATPSAPDTEFTPDRIGTYKVLLTVTNGSGLSATQEVTVLVGTSQPTAVVERATITVLVGQEATVSAAGSSSPSGNPLTYSWAIDARPGGSTASIGTPASATLRFTPDVAGTYTATVTVSDGPLSAVTPVTVVALSPSAGVLPLTYRPVLTTYSKALDRLIIAGSEPNALHIVDPAAGTDLAIPLPAPAKALSVSPNGRYAAVLHDNTGTLVDLSTRAVVQSFFTRGPKADIVALNTGAVVVGGLELIGFSTSWVYLVIDGATGNVAQSLNTFGFSTQRFVHADRSNRLLAIAECCGGSVQPIAIDPVTNTLTLSSPIAAAATSGSGPLWLSGNQAWLFNNGGVFYRTSDFGLLGNLIPASAPTGTRWVGFSHTDTGAEALAVEQLPGACCDFVARYPAVLKRWTGALLFAAADLTLPKVDAQQSYALAVHHANDERRVVLVQTGSDRAGVLGLRFYVLLR